MGKKKKLRKKLMAVVEQAWEDALRDVELSPRDYVNLRTSSSVELGRMFKKMLRDALWDRKHTPGRSE